MDEKTKLPMEFEDKRRFNIVRRCYYDANASKNCNKFDALMVKSRANIKQKDSILKAQ